MIKLMLLIFLGVIAAAAYMGYSIYQNQVQLEPLCQGAANNLTVGETAECSQNSPYREKMQYTAPSKIDRERCKELGGEYIVRQGANGYSFCVKM